MFGFLKKVMKTEDQVVAEELAADSTPQPYTASNLGRARYEAEHHMFRDFFFNNPTGFVDALMSEYGLCELHYEAMKDMKVKTRYGAGPYNVATGKTDRGDFILRAVLPVPEFVGLCYRIYLVFDKDFERIAYYTVERAEEGGRVGSWDAEGNYTVLDSLESPEWVEVTREQKADELAMIARYYYGDDYEFALADEGPVDEGPADEGADAEGQAQDAPEAGDAAAAEGVDAPAAEGADAAAAEGADTPAAEGVDAPATGN